MNECAWEIIESFNSPGEFERFLIWIAEQIQLGNAEEVTVKDSYAGPGFEEKWFQCKKNLSVWRLAFPQIPFRGYWGPV
jgi:hypothetical protein